MFQLHLDKRKQDFFGDIKILSDTTLIFKFVTFISIYGLVYIYGLV